MTFNIHSMLENLPPHDEPQFDDATQRVLRHLASSGPSWRMVEAMVTATGVSRDTAQRGLCAALRAMDDRIEEGHP
jgi:hypothetical protein